MPDFTFNEDVVRVFPDDQTLSTGLPHHWKTPEYWLRSLPKPIALYDLGCSLGAVTQAMRRHVSHSGCKVIAVDNSKLWCSAVASI